MAAETVGGETPTLFLRKATGLVRGWSVRDSIIYACLATNFVTLGIYEFTFAGPAFPKGQLITAILISGVWVSFLVIAYSGLIVTIPRAGGDYVWQSRILGGGIGFVMAVTGWWFILWLWAPIYGNILSVQLFVTLIEFKLTTLASFILVPFALWKRRFDSSTLQPFQPGAVEGSASGGLLAQRFGMLAAAPAFALPSGRPLMNSATPRF